MLVRSAVSRRLAAGLAVVIAAAAVGIGHPRSVSASDSQHGQPTVVLNPGGGIAPDGSDGPRLVLNGAAGADGVAGSDRLYYAGAPMYANDGPAPMLNVGGTLFGESGVAHLEGATSWDSVEILALEGSATATGGTDVGSGSVSLLYTATKGGLTYTVERFLLYVHPNPYIQEFFTVEVPAENTDHVVLYQGGDVRPAGDTIGYGASYVAAAQEAVVAVDRNETSYVGHTRHTLFHESDLVYGDATAVIDAMATVQPAIAAGSSIGSNVNGTEHDVALHTEWVLGTSPGTYRGNHDLLVGRAGVNLEINPSFTNEPGLFELQLTNTGRSVATGLGFTVEIPSTITIGSTPTTNDCDGTVTADEGTSTITLTGGELAGLAACRVRVELGSTVTNQINVERSFATSLVGVHNGISTYGTGVPGPTPVDPPPDFTNLGFVAINPTRTFDSRQTSGRIEADTSVEISVAVPGFPAATTAVLVNLTATDSQDAGYVTLYACGTTRPLASSLNLQPGHSVSNTALVRLSARGETKICAYSQSATHLIVDLSGLFIELEGLFTSPPANDVSSANLELLSFVPVEARRLLDTRSADKPAAGATVRVPLASITDVADPRAVVVTLTADDADGEGYVTAWPCDQLMPPTSSLNLKAGVQRANVVVSQFTVGHELCLSASRSTHLIVDTVGVFAPNQSTSLTSVAHERVLDTRSAAIVAGGSTVELALTTAPPYTTSVVLNVTATQSGGLGYVTVWQCGQPLPATSNLNLDPGVAAAANLVAVAIDSSAKVCLHASANTHLVVDVQGWNRDYQFICFSPPVEGVRATAC
ncbi:MAG: hypothetical protein AB7L13_00405 [Acidimicrobiia bacterium]